MPIRPVTNRLPENAPEKFYVTDQCLDCDLCREVAPEIFARNEKNGSSYVKRQPTNLHEKQLCLEAMNGCGVEAIQMTQEG